MSTKNNEFNSFTSSFFNLEEKNDDVRIVVKKNPDTILTLVLTAHGIVLPSMIVAYSRLAHRLLKKSKNLLRRFPQPQELALSNHVPIDAFRKKVGLVLRELREAAQTQRYAEDARCFHLIDLNVYPQFAALNPTAWVFGFYFHDLWGPESALPESGASEEKVQEVILQQSIPVGEDSDYAEQLKLAQQLRDQDDDYGMYFEGSDDEDYGGYF